MAPKKFDDDPNIQWKNAGVGCREKNSRRIDERQAGRIAAFKKDGSTLTPADLPPEINQSRHKICNLDEEEDDTSTDKELANAPASNKIYFNEDEIIEQERISSQKSHMCLQDKALKAAVVNTVQKFNGIAGLKSVSRESAAKAELDTDAPQEILKKLVIRNVVKPLKLKPLQRLKSKDIALLLRGIRRVEAIGGKDALCGMPLKHALEAGNPKTNDKKIARLILQKTGRKAKKKKLKKTSLKAQKEFNQIMLKQTALKEFAD